MPELRRNAISDQVVLVAPQRRQRPNDFAPSSNTTKTIPCPFCPGNEKSTPPAVDELHTADSPDKWCVRVVPNLYPALIDLDHSTIPSTNDSTPALGKHEVVIECRRHVCQFNELSPEESELVFLAYQRRLQTWKQNPRLRFGIAFKNSSVRAGASLEHVHSQLIGLTEIPSLMQTELDSAIQHYDRCGSCIFCDLLADERRQHGRIIEETKHFTAFCPPASRFAYEMWILPNDHCSHFEEESPDQVARAARFVHQNLRRLHGLTPPLPYNYLIHSAPFDSNPNTHYHWHIEVLPRFGYLAGFELGTGYSINAVSPDKAAQDLRNVDFDKVC